MEQDYHSHVPLTKKHATIRSISNGVDVGRNFMALLSLVQFNHLLGVDRQTLVRVHDDAEKTGVGLQTLVFGKHFMHTLITVTPTRGLIKPYHTGSQIRHVTSEISGGLEGRRAESAPRHRHEKA